MAARATMATRIPYSGSWRSRWSVFVVARGRGRGADGGQGRGAHDGVPPGPLPRPAASRATASMNARPRAA